MLLFELDILKKQEEFKKKNFIIVLYLSHFG